MTDQLFRIGDIVETLYPLRDINENICRASTIATITQVSSSGQSLGIWVEKGPVSVICRPEALRSIEATEHQRQHAALLIAWMQASAARDGKRGSESDQVYQATEKAYQDFIKSESTDHG